jgi:hypothetical protein
MALQRRQFLHLGAGAVALPAVSRIAWAQAYPTRPITIIDTYAAGGITDLSARIVAEPMSKLFGQHFIIENVGGADGNIGTGRAARAKPDGYTITIGTISTHVMNGALYSLPYAPAGQARHRLWKHQEQGQNEAQPHQARRGSPLAVRSSRSHLAPSGPHNPLQRARFWCSRLKAIQRALFFSGHAYPPRSRRWVGRN